MKYSLWILKDFKIFCANSKIWFFLFIIIFLKFINKLCKNKKTNNLKSESGLLSEKNPKKKQMLVKGCSTRTGSVGGKTPDDAHTLAKKFESMLCCIFSLFYCRERSIIFSF